MTDVPWEEAHQIQGPVCPVCVLADWPDEHRPGCLWTGQHHDEEFQEFVDHARAEIKRLSEVTEDA